jgi:hypothetical protein
MERIEYHINDAVLRSAYSVLAHNSKFRQLRLQDGSKTVTADDKGNVIIHTPSLGSKKPVAIGHVRRLGLFDGKPKQQVIAVWDKGAYSSVANQPSRYGSHLARAG